MNHCGKPLVKNGLAGSGNQRYKCQVCKASTTNPKKLEGEEIKIRERVAKTNRYFITCAQNNTNAHKAFFESIKRFCKHNKAELIVIPTLYRNVSLYVKNEENWYDPAIADYLFDGRQVLNKNFVVMGDIKIQATAVDPLSGMDTLSSSMSCVFGHPQIAVKMVATPADKIAKGMYTTGSLTLKNYSKTKVGAKGDHHHIFGGLYIEIDKDAFYPFQICADKDGSFYHLDKLYTKDGITSGHKAAALVTGDEHVIHYSPSVKAATYDKGGITSILQPDIIVRHDVHDHYSRNHHHLNDTFKNFKKYHSKIISVQDELDLAIKFIDETTPKNARNYIAASNHDEALDRWLNEKNLSNIEQDHENFIFFHELRVKYFKEKMKNPDIGAFEVYAKGKFKANVIFLSRNKATTIKGIDVSQHGDAGVNGAKGSISSLSKAYYKMIIGHSHTPGIRFGVYQVGHSAGKADYAKGLSSWCNTHCIIYPNGKRTLVNVINGKWRL